MESDKNVGRADRSSPELPADDSIPAGVDDGAIRRMKFISVLLDDSFRVPGTDYRVGLDPLLGLAPGGGDAVSAGISMYIVVEAARQGVSNRTIMRMLANVLVDTAVGSIPVLGDLFDAVFKANMRNLDLALADLGVSESRADNTETTIEIE